MNSLLKVAVVCLVMLVACSSGRVVLPDDADTEYNSEYALAKRVNCKCEGGHEEGTYWVFGCPKNWYSCKSGYVYGRCCSQQWGK
uniref:N.vectensis toxin 5 n=1 Tax=Nematostella vectensis TaxID=45351 RepID=NV5_NEMVE|nr:RecName: Full=N.vectensis toxin 5; Short=Nv5; Flags: Precursor [Nematostella vectensis]QEV81588.1 Nv5 toxin precursor [Nematostella vectensis]